MQLNAANSIILLFLVQCLSGGNSGTQPAIQKPRIQSDKAIIFHRAEEPNEKAFSFLLPEGWKIFGGITRIHPNSSNELTNSIGPKLYMKLVSPDEKTSIGWLPDNRFINKQQFASRNNMSTIHPISNNYNDLEEKAIMTPEEYLIKVAFPFAHPHAQNINVINTLPLKNLSEYYHQFSSNPNLPNSSKYSAAIITLLYIENGILFMEKMVCIIEDVGSTGGGLWGNKQTWFVRSESDKFEKMIPVLAKISESIQINREWFEKEIRNQHIYSQIIMKDQTLLIKAFIKEIDENRTRSRNEIIKKLFFSTLQKEENSSHPPVK